MKARTRGPAAFGDLDSRSGSRLQRAASCRSGSRRYPPPWSRWPRI